MPPKTVTFSKSTVHIFEVNGFDENSILIESNEGHEAILIDPGFYTSAERKQAEKFVEDNGLRLVSILLTHSHIDHILGLAWACQTFQLPFHHSAADLPNLEAGPRVGAMYGFQYEAPSTLLRNEIKGDLKWDMLDCRVLQVPGHAQGHLCFDFGEGYVVAGDTLFRESIGRTDLPGGNHSELITSIRNVLFALPNPTIVFPGHGPQTTIGHEKQQNPYLR
jgi:glyoxylase-like metal-dependent hydrolase (beta-lactamase superfamily II)